MQKVEEKALAVPDQAKQLTIVTEEDYSRAGELLLVIKDIQKEIDETFDPIIKKANQAHKEAVAQKKKVSAPLNEAEQIIKPRMVAWKAEQDKIREQEEARLRQEAEHSERERMIEEAMEAEARGDTEEAKAILEEPVVVPVPVVPMTPKVNGVSMREDWDFEVIDRGLIPRQYLIPNLVAIRAVVRGLKGQTDIPGIRIFKKTIVAAGRN